MAVQWIVLAAVVTLPKGTFTLQGTTSIRLPQQAQRFWQRSALLKGVVVHSVEVARDGRLSERAEVRWRVSRAASEAAPAGRGPARTAPDDRVASVVLAGVRVRLHGLWRASFSGDLLAVFRFSAAAGDHEAG